MTNKTMIAKAVKIALYSGAAASLSVAAPTFAADGEEEANEVLVTGSRIKRTDVEGANPVSVITREMLDASGKLNLGDVLKNETYSAGAAVNTSVNNGGSGATRFSLRGLGSQRVLILINGRRVVSSGQGANQSVDLNNIPTAIIERVEVLKDGASAVYGSDAIAGVVNVITRDNFEGLEANAYYGDTNDGGGAQSNVDVTFGTSSDNASLVASFSYVEQKPMFSGQRDWSAEALRLFEDGSTTAGGSSAPPWSNVNTPDGRFTRGPNFGDWRAYSGLTDSYNYAPVNYHLTPNDRWSASIFGSYDINENHRFFAEASYTARESARLIAPEPLAPLVFFGSPAPYSVDNIYNIMYGPQDANGNPYEITDWRRRMVETGGRKNDVNTQTYRVVTGIDGYINDNWTYEVFFNYGSNSGTNVSGGFFDLAKVANAVGPTMDIGGVLSCVGTAGDASSVIAGCVPLNALGIPGTDSQVTPEMLAYITSTGITTGGNKQKTFGANFAGTIGELAGGDLGMAIGLEHRTESGFSQPDQSTIDGISTAGSALATEGEYSVDELYVELDAPVLDTVNINAAVRYSDYDTFGDTTNHKVQVRWQPSDELVVRATTSTAFRAPSIPELFGGSSDGFPSATDPCATNPTSFCIADGVPAGGYDDAGQEQIRTIFGGNTDLQPEEADIFTAGLVYNPDFIDGLSLSVDFWKIELDNTITTRGTANILRACATGGLFCNAITRFGAGSGAPVGTVSLVDDRNTNGGAVDTEGWDLNVRYDLTDTSTGNWSFNFDTTYLVEYDKVGALGETISHAGSLKDNDDGNFPRFKANFRTNWSNGDWSAMYHLRYTSAVDEYMSTAVQWWIAQNFIHEVDAEIVHNVQFGYQATDNLHLTFGINNLLNEDPPFSGTAFNDNTDVRTYDTLGRFGYLRATLTF